MTTQILVFLIGFSIPISPAFTNIFCVLAVAFCFVKGEVSQLRHHPLVKTAMGLLVVMLIGMLYTSASWSEAGRMLDKYRELLYIPVFIWLFRDQPTRQLGLYAFLSAMGLTLLFSYCMAWGGWEIGKGTVANSFVFKNYITQGLLMSLAAYFLAVQLWQPTTRWRKLRAILLGLALYNVVFMIQGRTGYVVLASLVLLFMYQTYRYRGLGWGSLLVVISGLFAYQTSDLVQQRVNNVASGIEAYRYGEMAGSIPGRIGFLHNSTRLILQHPLLGTGTGSFTHEYQQLAQQQGILPTTNPHNEYLMIAVQWGMLGASLFIYLLYQLWTTSYLLPPQPAWMGQGLVVAMAIGCLFNSLLLDTTEGHLFAYLIGLFWGGLNPPHPSPPNSNQRGFWLALAAALLPTLWVYNFFIVANHSLLITDPKPIWEALQRPTSIASQFQTTLTTTTGMTVSVPQAQTITLTTKLQVAPQHLGRAAHLLIIAAYQASPNAPELWLQREGNQWQPLNKNYLKSEHYYPQLPASLEVTIYQGAFTATGRVKVWVGYKLENNTVVFMPKPIQFVVEQ